MNKTLWLGLLLILSGCNQSPFERTQDASNAGALSKFGSGSFIIFANELRSGGGAFLYPGSEGQVLSFSDTSNPIGVRSIRYFWNGQNVSNSSCHPDPEHTFAGFDLMHTALLADFNTTAGRDLRQAGYQKVTFFARGSLSTNTIAKVEVATHPGSNVCVSPTAPCLSLSSNGTDDDSTTPCGRTAQLTGDWQQYSIPVTASDLASIKDYFKSTFIFNPPSVGSTAAGQGGTVYFDQIQYQP